jgi:hypothetical protein
VHALIVSNRDTEPEYIADSRTNLADALDLSESEEEEYVEDLVEYFTQTRLDEVRHSSRLS